MKQKKIKIPIYFGDLIIIKTETEEEKNNIAQKNNLEISKNYPAFTFKNHSKNGYTKYIMIFEKEINPRIIAHESLHIVRYIFEDRGIFFNTFDNDEPQCYLLGWIVGECHKFLK